MKAITLWQPWASLISDGWKTIETRTHNYFKSLVGSRIAIHAGQRWDDNAHLLISEINVEAFRYCLELKEIHRQLVGRVLCTAFVFDAHWMDDSFIRQAKCPTEGLFGLFLRDVEKIVPPIPARGHQGVWEWTPEKR